ncbi:MAG: hypothetical protein K9H26_03290 [Prolixibacteraceae bacterium]|nr:hypothetical protein [Prolixibacteraceae bacterium]
MKKIFRYILSFFIILLMFFSTVGFNIISIICAGCEEEHTKVALATEIDSSCPCCELGDGTVCCIVDNEHQEEHHSTTSKLVRLVYDSPAAKSQAYNFNVPFNLLLNYYIVLLDEPVFPALFSRDTNMCLPLKTGRVLLSLNCILRN